MAVPTTPPPFRLDSALTSIEKMARLKPSKLYYTHFGVAEKAVEKLQVYADQLKLWACISKKTLGKGEGLEFMRKRSLS